MPRAKIPDWLPTAPTLSIDIEMPAVVPELLAITPLTALLLATLFDIAMAAEPPLALTM